ncbi:MAG: methyltransferase domain-containing protein [Firmicutes bacterium]|jgi:trans-aconitate methyltransferase|nr:methyltransferase domain-containing protein [Bacillota bacterium]
MRNPWDADHYDKKLRYVSEMGKGVVSLLDPKPGEAILDLGCGTGDLTHEMATSGAIVVGIDLSQAMIQQARNKYPHLQFAVGNGENFRIDTTFDAVFSNAALHWMKHPSRVIACVWNALSPGGRFVAEFGGKGNVETVIGALERALDELGLTSQEKHPWYFPSIGEYTTRLEKQGFQTTYAIHFDRPTVLPDGDQGLEHWLNGFAGSYLQGLDQPTRHCVMRRTKELSRPRLYKNGQWHVDYKRLRIAAVKP